MKQIIKSSDGKSELSLITQRERVHEFLKLLAVAHEVKPTEKLLEDGTYENIFNGPSPDEITLVDFAMNNGLQIISTADTEYVVRIVPESGLIQKSH
jgi:hypothetical protein